MTNKWLNRILGRPAPAGEPSPAQAPVHKPAAPVRKEHPADCPCQHCQTMRDLDSGLFGESMVRAVIGEAEDEKDEKPKAEPEAKKEAPEREPLPAPATDEPEGESEAAVDADIEAGAEASADTSVDSQTVEHLVSSWESGSKMDVASQLMYTPVSYVDFVKMLFRIGEEGGVELGGMLDQLSEVRPSIDQPGGGGAPEAPEQGSAQRVLSRIAKRREAGMPVAEPAGETAPELDTAP